MYCILCVNLPDHIIDIFGEDGLRLDAANVIVKHFWMQPNKDDDNARYICCNCWDLLDAFHKFYQQVEAAHIALAKAAASTTGALKQEIPIPVDSQTENYDLATEFLSTDVKLEVKDDSELALPQYDPLPDIEEKIDINLISDTRLKPDISESEDSEYEIPLANLAKTKIKTRSDDDSDAGENWQARSESFDTDDDSEDEDDADSEFEIKKVKTKEKTATKPVRKRGRPPKETTPKQTTEEQQKKLDLSQGYDEVISKNMKLSCHICLDPLDNFFVLKKHFRAKHQQRGYAHCCGKKFLKRGILVDHIHTHLDPEHFKCEKCGKVLADRRCLEVHMNTHVPEKQRLYQCDKCCKSFFKKPLLTRHMYLHIPEEERKFRCEECNKVFPSNYTRRAHINNVHQNAYAKICDQCGKSIRGREAFHRHLQEHAGVPIPSVQCEKCGAKLRNKYGLKRHMNSMHAEKSNDPHKCSICGKIAPNQAALQRHHAYVHACPRNHKCPMCGKGFKKPGGLREHMTTHTGEVLYTCPHCPKTFNSNANMHSHRKKMHRKEWEENRRHPHMGTAPNND